MSKRSAVWIGLNKRIRKMEKTLKMEREDHEAVIYQLTGKSSLGNCCDAEMELVADALQEKLPAMQKSSFKPSAHAHVRKIWKLWGLLKKGGYIEAKNDKAALLVFINNMISNDRKLDSLKQIEWLTPSDASPIIEALKSMCSRHGIKVR